MKKNNRLISLIMTIALILSLGSASFASADMLPPDSVTVTYDPQGGAPDSGYLTEIVYNGIYDAIPTVSREGYIFDGWWWRVPGGGGELVEQGYSLKTPEDHTLYARWTAITYTVTFESQDENVDAMSLSLSYGTNYANLPTPVRTGYRFDGWSTSPNGPVNINVNSTVEIQGDHTLYAFWTPIITVNFDSMGGSPVPEKNVYLNELYGELPVPADATRTFVEWRTDANDNTSYIQAFNTVINQNDHTLYAIWGYRVTFNPQGGTMTALSRVYAYNEMYGGYEIPSYPGYTFDGWYTAPNGGSYVGTGTMMSTPSDHTLYAKWTPNTYTTTFDLQGGSLTTGSTTKTVTYDSAYGELPYATKNDYILKGWWTEPNGAGTEVTSATQVTTLSDQMLYAKWRHPSYPVILSSPGTGITPLINCTYDEPYGNLGIPSYPGYTFEGWYTASDDSGTLVTADTIVSNLYSHTIYARWTPNTYTVTFNAQYGVNNPAAQTYTFGSTYSNLPTPTRTGYSFAGWYTASDDSGTLVQTSTTVSTPSNHTLYAKWTPNTYTVTFDPQDGSLGLFDNATITVAYDAAYGDLPSASNFPLIFGGWWTGPFGTGTRITSATPVTITANQTLYAKWMLDSNLFNQPPPPPILPPPPIITPGLGGHSGYITPPPPPPPPPVPPGIIPNMILRNIQQDGTQRVIPGNFDQNTNQFRFLYDVLPEGAGNSGFMTDYDTTPPSGISQGHWAYQTASRLLAQGILNDEPIIPGAIMTRGDLIAMLYRTVAFPLNPTGSPGFSDTTSNDTTINWATERGIINGLPDGTFRPDAEISRQETFVIIARFLEAYKIEFPNTDANSMLGAFSDAGDIADWARGDIDTFVQYGIVRGAPGNNGPAINPLRDITQEEMIALISRMIGICY